MNKNLLLAILLMVICHSTYAQQTSLIVDCQTPGWLSSKINYGDQQTVRDLTVTGYINSTDLLFIGQLITGNNLDGKLDLEDVNIIGTEKNEKDNVLASNMFGVEWASGKDFNLKHLILPLSATKSSTCLGRYLSVDTLTAGGYAMHVITKDAFSSFDGGTEHNFNITNLILREGTDSIMDYAFTDSRAGMEDINPIKKVSFPPTLKYIGEKCFYKTSLDTFSLDDNIEEIGELAFFNIPYTPDSLILPKKLKLYYASSFNIKEGQIIYIPKSVTKFFVQGIGSYHLEFHLESTTPIPVDFSSLTCLSNCTVYVPKGSLDLYKAERNSQGSYNAWKYALLLEEPCHVENVKLDKTSATLKIGEILNLYATISPYNADNTSLIWSSDNEAVATVDARGKVTALKSGKAYIKVVSVDNPNSTDSCLIDVINPIEDIKLNAQNLSLNVGDEKQLKVSFTPTDADNKEVLWTSSDEEVATVSK